MAFLVKEKEKGPDNWVQDMVNLPELTEANISNNLKYGYQGDEIYTYVGPVLVSINPFKALPTIYGKDIIAKYAAQKQRGELKPHVYTIAQMAFHGLIRGQKNQSILVSGESGAGKTEAVKHVLSYITAQSAKGANGVSLVEKQILEANPLLEAFGNAKTTRNNNSSRFGKFTKIFFKDSTITGSAVEQYLLEKSRVVFQGEGDRNYHIFYHMLAGLSQEEKNKLGLKTVDDYHYLNQSSVREAKGVNDAALWKEIQEAMTTFQFADEERNGVTNAVAAILHVGNIQFKFNEELKRMEPADKSVISRVAELLGLAHPQILEIVLTTRKLSGGNRGSSYSVSNTAEEVVDFRDALAKHLYARLFEWLVRKINVKLIGFDPYSLKDGEEDKTKLWTFIGVLDIFGFEIFQHNSFEQLCINFANEKLHQQFLEFMFKVEQEQYTAEGISWSAIQFEDNRPCVELIEAKGGVLSMLDEECLVPKGTDETFLQKLETAHAKHAYYGAPKRGKKAAGSENLGPGFEVKHFAYTVFYETEGFLNKNRDRLYPDIEGALQRSKDKLIKSMFPSEDGGGDDKNKKGGAPSKAAPSGAPKKKPSLGGLFKSQLDRLYSTIFATEPHYIRCIKPNPQQVANNYEDEYVARQLRYVGVMETIRVRKAGYSLRASFPDFIRRFGFLAPAGMTDHGAMVRHILDNANGLDKSIFVVGKTKVFMKDSAVVILDEMLMNALKAIACQIQSCVRGMLGRRNLLLEQAMHHKKALEVLRERQKPVAFLVQSAARAMFVRSSYNQNQLKFHQIKLEERKRREEEERRRKEEEERRRKEEEERKKREEEERIKREEDEKKKLAAMADAERQKAEEEFRRQEAERKKAEEERRRLEEEVRRAKEEEEQRKREEEQAKAREALAVNVPAMPTAAELQKAKVVEVEEKKPEVVQEKEEEEQKRLAMALFDYDGKFLKDGAALMLRKWQVVEIIDELSNDWWLGSALGQEGLFPAAYVEELPDAIKTVVADYDFESSTDGHLNFLEGQTITVVEERDSWMWGHFDGTYGRFPANYCYDVSAMIRDEPVVPQTTVTTTVGGKTTTVAAPQVVPSKIVTQVQMAAGVDKNDPYAKVPVFNNTLPAGYTEAPMFLRTFVQRKLLRCATPLDHSISVIRGKDLNASPMRDIAMYLFDDILFFARYHAEDLQFDAVFYVSLSDARLIELSVSPERQMEGFQIEVKGRSLYTFIFDLPSQKRDWREDTKLVVRKYQVSQMMKAELEAAGKSSGKGDTMKRKSSLYTTLKDKLTGGGKEKAGAKSVDVVGLLNPCQLFISELPEMWKSMFSQLGVSEALQKDDTAAHLDAFSHVHVACILERSTVKLAKEELMKSLEGTMDTMRKKTLSRSGAK